MTTEHQTAPAGGPGSARAGRRTAGTFDIRNIIGALLGIFGLVLVLAYLLLDPGMNPDAHTPKLATDNLWTGLGMIALAVVFMLWARFKPIVVEDPAAGESVVGGGEATRGR